MCTGFNQRVYGAEGEREEEEEDGGRKVGENGKRLVVERAVGVEGGEVNFRKIIALYEIIRVNKINPLGMFCAIER